MPKRKRDKPKGPEPKRKSCTICLSLIRNEASLDNCSHTFCKKCIMKWSKTENTCPQCRNEFTCVSTKKKTRIVHKKRQGEDNRTVDMIMNECLWLFVTDNGFKDTLAYRFVNNRTPFITFVCQALNHILTDISFVDNIKEFCEEEGYTDFRDNLDEATNYIETLIRLNPVSITT